MRTGISAAHIGAAGNSLRDMAAGGVSLDFLASWFIKNGTDGTDMAITSDFANIASVTRASKAWYDGWDGTSGGAVGPLVEFASNTTRRGALGFLIAGQASTNEIRNPRAEGGTAGTLGSGGALPTYWADNGSRLQTTGCDVAYGTENGREYIELDVSGTPPGSPLVLYFEANDQIVAASGEDWTTGLDIKLVSGDFTNIDSVEVMNVERTAGGSLVTQDRGSDIKASLDTTIRRFYHSTTLSGGGTVARLQSGLRFGWTSGAVAFVLRVYMPQAENQPCATSIILPDAGSPAASTRAAEGGNVVVANGSYSNDNGPGTLAIEFMPRCAQSDAQPRLLVYGSDANNCVALRLLSGGTASTLGLVGGVGQFALTGAAFTPGSVYKAAVSFAANDIFFSGGGTTSGDTSASVAFGTSQLVLGADIGGANPLNGEAYYRDIRYFPRQLSDADVSVLGSA